MNTRGAAAKKHPVPSIMLDDDTKKYFENLISPLAKSSEIEELRTTIELQKNEIKSLKEDLAAKTKRIEAMELELTRINNNSDVVYKKADDNEQYHRRYCTRINGIAVPDKEATDDVMALVEHCHTAIGLPFDPNEIDRAHRVGKPRKHPVTKKVTQQIIVKFKSWNARCAFYNARPKFDSDASRSFTTSLDLTNRRYKLLSAARELVKDNADVRFAFADINCRLAVKMKDNSKLFFDSEPELRNLLGISL